MKANANVRLDWIHSVIDWNHVTAWSIKCGGKKRNRIIIIEKKKWKWIMYIDMIMYIDSREIINIISWTNTHTYYSACITKFDWYRVIDWILPDHPSPKWIFRIEKSGNIYPLQLRSNYQWNNIMNHHIKNNFSQITFFIYLAIDKDLHAMYVSWILVCHSTLTMVVDLNAS